MRDIRSTDDDNLAAQALLYANGEMDADDARAFEQRLNEDQRVREALCQAVELARTLEGGPPPTPNPSYRAGVRVRLRSHGVLSRRYRGHPVFWTAIGAAASVLLAACVNHFAAVPTPGVPDNSALSAKPQAADPALDEAARAWADIPKHDHLSRVREEEQRRKIHRSEEMRIVRNEVRPNRFLTEPMQNP
jgi:anti-sigma-K factor RskA